MATQFSSEMLVNPGGLTYNSAVQEANLGQYVETNDGRGFRYVKCGGTALVPGKLYQAQATTTGWQNLDVASAVIGATQVVTTSTVSVTANQLVDGYVAVTITPGQGYFYKIKSHAAASSAVVTLNLEDPLVTVLTAGASKVDLVASPFAEVELWDASNHDGVPVGVAMNAVTAEYYGWLQVKGPCNVLIDEGNGTVGEGMQPSDDTDGAVGLFEASYYAGIIGTAMTASSSGEYGMVYLNIS